MAMARAGDAAPLAAYMKDPTPGVALVFEAIRFDFEGDDKRKQDRVRKFYSAIPRRGRIAPLRQPRSARAKPKRWRSAPDSASSHDALDLLVEALGADIARIAVEIEKLALYAGNRDGDRGRYLGAGAGCARHHDLRAGKCARPARPGARARGAGHAHARGRISAAGAGVSFDAVPPGAGGARSGAEERRARFNRTSRASGVPMWGSRADQISQTASKFSKPQLERAMRLIFEADRGLRDARPDDRIVMEQFILQLVA